MDIVCSHFLLSILNSVGCPHVRCTGVTYVCPLSIVHIKLTRNIYYFDCKNCNGIHAQCARTHSNHIRFDDRDKILHCFEFRHNNVLSCFMNYYERIWDYYLFMDLKVMVVIPHFRQAFCFFFRLFHPCHSLHQDRYTHTHTRPNTIDFDFIAIELSILRQVDNLITTTPAIHFIIKWTRIRLLLSIIFLHICIQIPPFAFYSTILGFVAGGSHHTQNSNTWITFWGYISPRLCTV